VLAYNDIQQYNGFMNKTEQLAKLSEEILSNFESGVVSLEQIILRSTKLARLSGDNDALKWLRLELNGYSKDSLPVDIKYDEACKLAYRSNRPYLSTDPKTGDAKNYIIIESVPGLEAEIEASQVSLQSITLPTHVTPNQNSFQNESYTQVLNNVRKVQNSIIESIKRNRNHLAKIKSGVYNYVFGVYSQYTFEVVVDSIFNQIKQEVDTKLKELVPDALAQFTSAFNRLRDGEGEDFSQAVSTCRNILDSFADAVYPPQSKGEATMSSGEKLKIGKDSYKNRLIAFIDSNISKSSDALLTKARAEELVNRLHHVHRVLSKGAKTRITKAEAQRYVIETYLLIGELISYIPKDSEKAVKAKQ
jgi:hypothetical protein